MKNSILDYRFIYFPIKGLIYFCEVLFFPFILLAVLVSRWKKKAIDVGLGPEPLINNVYHKQALEKYGYTAETCVGYVYTTTSSFDLVFDDLLRNRCRRLPFGKAIMKIILRFQGIILFVFFVLRYRCVYIYFNGGPLNLFQSIYGFLEPYLYKLAKVKVVVMPYGGDVQDLLRTPHLLFRHVISQQYPSVRFRRLQVQRNIDRWTRCADHVISGCDWVEYMYYWDTLMLAHFSIDVQKWIPKTNQSITQGPLRILHAPNHRHVKGTQYFIQAVEELKKEGVSVELVIMEKVPNQRVLEEMEKADVVADQLIIGWYAMFALEGMAMGKPVLCYLKNDFINLYIDAGLVGNDEIPIVNCNKGNVKEKIRELADNRERLKIIGEQSRAFVEKHHSLEAIGKVFDCINTKVGIGGK